MRIVERVVLVRLVPCEEVQLGWEIVARVGAWHDPEVVEACSAALVVADLVFLEQGLASFFEANQVQVHYTCMGRSLLLR